MRNTMAWHRSVYKIKFSFIQSFMISLLVYFLDSSWCLFTTQASVVKYWRSAVCSMAVLISVSLCSVAHESYAEISLVFTWIRNNMTVSKWWQTFQLWLNCPLKPTESHISQNGSSIIKCAIKGAVRNFSLSVCMWLHVFIFFHV